MTGCTYGKGNLLHRDLGKNAFTFYGRARGRALRIVSRPNVWGPRRPEDEELSARVRAGRATPEEGERFRALQQERSEAILEAPLERLFDVRDVEGAFPHRARIHQSLICAACGEATMETRTRRFDGETLCIPCFERRESRI